VGRRLALTCGQDPLIPISGLFVEDDTLIFRRENQDRAFWGVPLDRADQEDPPVAVQSHDGRIPFLDRMPTAWVELVLSETLFARDTTEVVYDARELANMLLPPLRRQYRRVDIPDHPSPTRAGRASSSRPHPWVRVTGRGRASAARCSGSTDEVMGVKRRDGAAAPHW
jgi:hypothetical protein